MCVLIIDHLYGRKMDCLKKIGQSLDNMYIYILIYFIRVSTVVSKLLKVTQEIRSQVGPAPRSSDPWCQENLPYSTGRSLCLLPIFLAQHRRFYRAGGGTEASDGVTLREVLGVMNSVGKSQESSTVQKQIKQQGSNRQWHSTETKKSSSLNQEE